MGADGFGKVVNIFAVAKGAEHAGAQIQLLEMHARWIAPDVEIEIEGVRAGVRNRPASGVEREPRGARGRGVSATTGEGMGFTEMEIGERQAVMRAAQLGGKPGQIER